MNIKSLSDEDLILFFGEKIAIINNDGYDISEIISELKYRNIIVEDDGLGNCYRLISGGENSTYNNNAWLKRNYAWLFWMSLGQPVNSVITQTIDPVKLFTTTMDSVVDLGDEPKKINLSLVK